MSHSVADRDRHLHAHLSAFNSAFAELGLRFRWDAQTLHSLASIDGDRARIATYIEAQHAHLLTAYSIDFLCEAILALKRAQAPGEWFAVHAVRQESARETPAVRAGWEQDWRDTGSGLPALAGA